MAATLTDGYYRVQNNKTERYVYVMDNRGSVNLTATSADVNAMQLWRNPERVISDPASIIYFKSVNANEGTWDLTAQGTSVYSIISAHVSIYGLSDGTFLCYGEKSGLAKYLGDIDSSNDDMGIMSIDGKGDNRKWRVLPISATGTNYLGVKPTVQAAGKYYQPYYTGFPYSANSAGMKFYAVTRVEKGLAVIEEISGTVPASTPVIVECSSTQPSSNCLNIGGTGTAPAKNLLAGVYFHNTMESHLNLTKFEPATMRVLAADASGKLVFTNAVNLQNIPANQSYLRVPAGSPSVIKVVTPSQFEAEAALIPSTVAINGGNVTLQPGKTIKLTYTITPATAASDAVKWTSSAPSVATVASDGTVTAVGKGSADITVTTSNGLTSTVKVTVAPLPEGIELSATSATLYENDTVQLTATVKPADASDKTVTWTASAPSVATVSATGLVTGKTPGVCDITASTSNGYKAVCRITVEHKYIPVEGLQISTRSLTLVEGDSAALIAKVLPANADEQTITWVSWNKSVATVSQTGVVKAVAPGSGSVTAQAGGKSVTVSVTVTRRAIPVESITLSHSTLTLTAGAQQLLTATVNPSNADDTNVTWTSSNSAVASVTAIGRVIAKAEGEAVITAACGGKTATCTVKVKAKAIPVSGISLSHTELTVNQGETATLVATVTPENADDKTVTWTSDDSSIATVADGVVTGIAPGSVRITASANGYVAFCYVTVKKPVATSLTVSPESYEGVIGSEFRLTWTLLPALADQTVVFSSSNTNVATVTPDGTVRLVAEGSAVIRVATPDGSLSAECSINALSSLDEIIADTPDAPLYDLTGRMVLRSVTSASSLLSLPRGIYILAGRKIVI